MGTRACAHTIKKHLGVLEILHDAKRLSHLHLHSRRVMSKRIVALPTNDFQRLKDLVQRQELVPVHPLPACTCKQNQHAHCQYRCTPSLRMQTEPACALPISVHSQPAHANRTSMHIANIGALPACACKQNQHAHCQYRCTPSLRVQTEPACALPISVQRGLTRCGAKCTNIICLLAAGHPKPLCTELHDKVLKHDINRAEFLRDLPVCWQ